MVRKDQESGRLAERALRFAPRWKKGSQTALYSVGVFDRFLREYPQARLLSDDNPIGRAVGEVTTAPIRLVLPNPTYVPG